MAGTITRTAAACLWGVLALPVLPAAAPAQGVAAPEGQALAAFCHNLEGIIAAENAREAADFADSLAKIPEDVRGERRLETDAVLTPDEAAVVAGRLWAMWVATSPAATVGIVEDGPDAWLLAPSPGPAAPAAMDPIRIDKHTGVVTWKLPHPSEHERLQTQVCAAGG